LAGSGLLAIRMQRFTIINQYIGCFNCQRALRPMPSAVAMRTRVARLDRHSAPAARSSPKERTISSARPSESTTTRACARRQRRDSADKGTAAAFWMGLTELD